MTHVTQRHVTGGTLTHSAASSSSWSYSGSECPGKKIFTIERRVIVTSLRFYLEVFWNEGLGHLKATEWTVRHPEVASRTFGDG